MIQALAITPSVNLFRQSRLGPRATRARCSWLTAQEDGLERTGRDPQACLAEFDNGTDRIGIERSSKALVNAGRDFVLRGRIGAALSSVGKRHVCTLI